MRPLVVIVCVMLIAFPLPGCFETGGGEARHRLPVGAYNMLYLRGGRYTSLLLEIDYARGHPPSDQAIDQLKQRIRQYCDKEKITVEKEVFDSDDDSYTLDEIIALEKKVRSEWTSGHTVVVHYLYLNGKYQEDQDALGLAYYESSIAIFKERIDEVAETSIPNPIFVTPEDIEKSVVVHEFGHLLGLVNINYQSERDHEDSESEHHCVHEDCVMNKDVETTAIAGMVRHGGTKPPTDFCDDCRADLLKLREE